VGGWEPYDSEIVAGKRRLHPKRRRTHGRAFTATVTISTVLAVSGLAAGGYYWLHRPRGLAALPNPAVVAPGGFRTSIGAQQTITVGLEVSSVANVPLTLVDAKITPPPGLTQLAISIIPPGTDNEGFALDGPLPSQAPVPLGTAPANRNAVLAAQFRVDCAALPPAGSPTGEEIFVTIEVGSQRRVDELTPPVVDDTPWLTATAQRLCLSPLPSGSGEPPLPPLPGPSVAPSG
jgi:hypothetical protein